jgi:hypothetical protein
MSTVVKIAAVAAFYRIFATCFASAQNAWIGSIQVISILTLVVANVTAAYQSNVKRMLAYSSVGHVGYILLAFVASPQEAGGVIFYYLLAYSVASIMAFIVLHTLESVGERTTIDDFLQEKSVTGRGLDDLVIIACGYSSPCWVLWKVHGICISYFTRLYCFGGYSGADVAGRGILLFPRDSGNVF